MKRFPYARTLVVGFGFLGISILWPIFNQFIPLFLQAGNPEFERQLLEAGRDIPKVVGFALPPSLALFMMTWDNIINIFLQPWAGERSDHTRTRFGRRKPWILLGLPVAIAGFVFIPFAQSILAIAAFILITNLGMALFRSPTIAWLGDLYQPQERSKANGIINLMGGIGGLLAFFGGGYLFDAFGRHAPFLAGAVAMAVTCAVALVFVREPAVEAVEASPRNGVLTNVGHIFKDPDRSELFVLLGILLWFMAFNALETGLSSFAVFTLGIRPGLASIYAGTVTISFILFALPSGLIAARIGRRRTILIGLLGLTLLLPLGFIFVREAITFIAALALAGLFWALVNVNSLPLVYDYGDESKIGAYTGLYYFASQCAAVLGPTLGGVLVDMLGDQYRWLWLFSAVFMALALWTMTHVRPTTPYEKSASLIP